MTGNYYPAKDSEFAIWLGNFVTNAQANLAVLGLVAADIDPIKALSTTLNAMLNDVENKKAALAAAVESKDATKDSVLQKVRIVVNKIQANPSVPSSTKALLGINTGDGGSTPQQAISPSDLVAELLGDGSVELDWSRNGNGRSVQFAIEYNAKEGDEWQLLDVVSKTSYIHKGVKLGSSYRYRVKTRKAGEESQPSNIAYIGA